MKSPIADHKEKDVTLLRKVLLGIVEGEKTTQKDKIEASKLLLRAHHALQAERVDVKEKKKDELPKKVKDGLNDQLAEILGHLQGPRVN